MNTARKIMILAFAILAVGVLTGCSAKAWAVDADDGTHKTHWNHGLVIRCGTEFYIGPGNGSYTDIEHDWTAHVDGVVNGDESETGDQGQTTDD